jgi:hypothetical protein
MNFRRKNCVHSERIITPELLWQLQTHTWEEVKHRVTERQPIPSLLRLRRRSSACVLRRVPALLVFYSSFGSQNTMQCKSESIKMPSTVLILKREKRFHLPYTCSHRRRLGTPCSIHPSFLPSYSSSSNSELFCVNCCYGPWQPSAIFHQWHKCFV